MILFHPSILDIQPAEEALAGFESIAPGVPVFGGLAIDNMKLVSNFEFLDEEIFERGAVALGFADPTLEVIAGANHGFSVTGEPFEVTRVEGNRVSELDGRPAWDSLTARLAVPPTTDPAEIAAFTVVGEELP